MIKFSFHLEDAFTLTMTLYLSYPMNTIVIIEATPVTAPVKAYSLQPQHRTSKYRLVTLALLHTEGSPHPISLFEDVDDDGRGLGDHHAHVGEREVHHEHVRGGPKGFYLKICQDYS